MTRELARESSQQQSMMKMKMKMKIGAKILMMSSLIISVSLVLILISFKSHLLLPIPPAGAAAEDDHRLAFSILIGILTRPDKYERRHFLRMVYGIQHKSMQSWREEDNNINIEVKFVLCNLTKPEQRVLVGLEMLRYEDIIILDSCTNENMNSGKTYAYFSSLPRIHGRRRGPYRYDYVMKADDDVFIRLPALALSLRPLPRVDLYYGFVIPCGSNDPFLEKSYMSGMGFVVSWDLVEWIAHSDIPRNHTLGPEDKLVGKWFDLGNRAKNRYSNKPAMYDYPATNGRCSHQLIPQTLAVHRLKTWDQWFNVLNYFFFNLTPTPTPQS